MHTLPLPPRSPADLDTWLATTSPTDVAIGLVLPVAALLAAYLSAVGVLYLVALLLRAPRAVRALAPVTPAGIRAVAERAVAASLLTTTWVAPAAAVTASGGAGTLPPGLRVPAAVDAGEVRAPALDLPTVPAPPATSAPTPEVAPPEVAPPRRAAGTTAEGSTDGAAEGTVVVVEPGDHLWRIAARAVAAARGVAVGDVPAADVAGHWREVIRVNRPHLRSGDPDVIHPGEEVRLPPVGTGDP